MKSTLEKLLDKNNFELRQLRNKSNSWFLDQTMSLLSPLRAKTPEQIMSGSTFTDKLTLGQMVMFIYDPKHKATLPYYDRLPLVLPFNTAPGGFLGLNLHYLPPRLRARLLTLLLEHKTNKTLTEKTRIAATWQTLNSSSKSPYVSFCVKHYLTEHMKTRFKVIHPSDWANAVMLPTERFEKEGLQKIWQEAIKKLGK